MCLAIPGKITEIREDDPVSRMGTVDFGGVSKEINLSFVPEAEPGDYVLVHAGFALNTVDEEEAKRVFDYLREIEELGSQEADEAGPGQPRRPDLPGQIGEPALPDDDEARGSEGPPA